MDRLPEENGDDPQGLTRQAAPPRPGGGAQDAMALLRQASQYHQAKQGNVSTPEIEANKQAMAANSEAIHALKYSVHGIPEGINHVDELERLKGLINTNQATANDLDNFITLEQFMKDQTARTNGEMVGSSGSELHGSDGAIGAGVPHSEGASAGAASAQAAPAPVPSRRNVQSGGSNGPVSRPHVSGVGEVQAPAPVQRPGMEGRNGRQTPPKANAKPAAKPAVEMGPSMEQLRAPNPYKKAEASSAKQPSETSRTKAVAKVAAREMRNLSPEERAQFGATGISPLNGEGWDQAKYNGPFKSAEEMRDAMGSHARVEREGQVGSPEFIAATAPLLLGAAGAYGMSKAGPKITRGGQRLGAAMETADAMLNRPKTPAPVNNNISRVAKPPGLQNPRGMMQDNLSSSEFGQVTPNVRSGGLGGLPAPAKAAQLRKALPSRESVQQTIQQAESAKPSPRPAPPSKSATEISHRASEYLEKRDNPSARMEGYTSQKPGNLKVVPPAGRPSLERKSSSVEVKPGKTPGTVSIGGKSAPKRTEGYSTNTQTPAAVKRNSMNKSQRAADANKKGAAEAKTEKTAGKLKASPTKKLDSKKKK